MNRSHSGKLRVLHVISGLDPRSGGPSGALAGLAAAQVQCGLDVSICSTWVEGQDRSLAEKVSAAGASVSLVGPARGRLLSHPHLGSTVDELVGRVDVVHIHALWEEIQHQAARSAQRRQVPYIIRPCGMLDPWSLRQSRWMKRLYMFWRLRRNLNRASAIHFTAQTECELTAALRLNAMPIIEPNGISLDEFQALPPPGTFRSRYPQLHGRLMLLFLSRLHPKKGLELLLPAFAHVDRSDTTLVIAGPDSEGFQARLERIVEQHGIGDRVIFTGMLRGADRVAALADADLFVLPSHQENFGIAVVEALAAGKPVIVSDQVNIHREISEAGVGAVVPLDVNALANDLNRWLSDERLRAEAAGRARAFVRERYDWRKIAQRWAGHYQRLKKVDVTF